MVNWVILLSWFVLIGGAVSVSVEGVKQACGPC